MPPRTTRQRFYYSGHIRAADAAAFELSPGESHHLLRVLRLRAGAQVDLFDAGGRGYFAEVVGAERGIASLRVLGAHELEPVAGSNLNVAVAVLKRRAMDWLIEKLSELGVDTFQPLLTAHCVALPDIRPDEDPPQRWERLAIAAAKQCGRNRPLSVLRPAPLDRWLKRDRPPAHTAFAHFDPEAPTLGEWLHRREDVALPRWIAIGPEGGWSAEEADAFRLAGFNPVRLGALTLRAETAAMAAVAACRLL
jgi:16S rRNA (uracil1498-N3)-methyltransferase